MISNGLSDYSWNYININYGWQVPDRSPAGQVMPNSKFEEMKGLGDMLQAEG
ncbi:hypothetical protein [Mucilaginibacter sp. KACC 22063]|uniref:hypothetical protein n=1 Tax=Mucilaginibacter sp. KACC 22063 TaxID=3025666 RepID=UPI0023669A77|nr:hypothetical protein [Mucilaginibacter sp. KACC 22063]WDF55842.1 hypothetical protein PQ461_02045 [Mucilaginibacter sp. KACC 22063]